MSRVFKDGAVRHEPFSWSGKRIADASTVEPLIPAPATPPAGAPEPALKAEDPPQPPPVDLDRIRKQAFQEGFQAGEEAGRKDAEGAAARKIAKLGGSVESLLAFKRRLRDEVEREVVDLAFAVARRVLRRELSVDPKATAGIVRSCMDEANAYDIQRVRAHPDEAELIREAVGDDVEVVPDAGVQRGGAVLETARGRLDAQIDTQLEEIERGLADQ